MRHSKISHPLTDTGPNASFRTRVRHFRFSPNRDQSRMPRHFGFGPIVLQKSKVATPRIFRENKKRETIADSHTLNRVAEIAGEFDARGPAAHIFTPKTRLQPAEFLITCAKRLLQQYRPGADMRTSAHHSSPFQALDFREQEATEPRHPTKSSNP